MRIDTDGLDQVLEVPHEPGMVAHVEEYADSNGAKLWFWDSSDAEATEPLFPALVRTPLSWFPDIGAGAGERMLFALTVLARDAEFFPDENALANHAELGRFASRCIIPVGLFVENDEAARPTLLVIGEILTTEKARNGITGEDFWVLQVSSLGGELTVALPLEAMEEDCVGQIVAVQGMASGNFPDLIPEPISEKRDGGDSGEEGKFELKDVEVESRLRELVIEFYDSPEFEAYFSDIHVDSFTRKLCLVFGIFMKAARQMPKLRGRATPKLAARYRSVARNAPIVMARIVMANTMLLYDGKSSPALVVVGFGEGAEEAMDRAREVLSRVHFGRAETEEERELAKLIEDEEYCFGRRRRLPNWLVGDTEVYAADLWVPGTAAHGDGLVAEVIVCFAEPGIDGLTAALPSELVTRAIQSAKGPPPLPPRE